MKLREDTAVERPAARGPQSKSPRSATKRRRALLFVNRKARGGAANADAAAKYLQELGFDLLEGSALTKERLSKQIYANRERVDLAIIGGGDGTLNGAVDALVETDLPLGILPLGTANDMAQTLGLPKDVRGACEVIAAGEKKRIDLGTVNGKYFLNEAGLGLSFKLARRLTQQGKGAWGIFAVGSNTLSVLAKAKPFSAEIAYGSQTLRTRTMHIMVGNGRNFGGWLRSAEASVDDKMLDLYSFEIETWRDSLKALPGMIKGEYSTCPGVRLVHGKEFEIRTRRARYVDTDGEITTRTPAHFLVAPHVLQVFVPAGPDAAA